MRRPVNGGYDDGYIHCPCFWGKVPGSLVRTLFYFRTSVRGLRVLDVGCGEGKNSVYLAEKGAKVDAVDVSIHAIRNARKNWGEVPGVRWLVRDIRDIQLDPVYDIVIAYGLFHCIPDRNEVLQVISKLQHASVVGGYHVLCMFNDRDQDLHNAHPRFDPCLLAHETYISLYSSWRVLVQSDQDLTEQHPHNRIVHSHSLTRILARKTS